MSPAHPYRIHEESVMCEEDFTMKKYRVNVNGTVYEVELEEIPAQLPLSPCRPLRLLPPPPQPLPAAKRSALPCPATFWR